MQLVVKQADQFVKEYHFERGLVYIGREVESHICSSTSRSTTSTAGGAEPETQWFAK